MGPWLFLPVVRNDSFRLIGGWVVPSTHFFTPMTHIKSYPGKVTGVVRDPCPAEICMDKNSVWIDIFFSVHVYWDKTSDVQDQLCNLCTAIFINFVCFNNGFLLEYYFTHYVLMACSIMLYWRFNFFLALYLMYLAHQTPGTCATLTELKSTIACKGIVLCVI